MRLERTLRATAFVALAAWIANAARPALARVETANDAQLADALRQWTRATTVDTVHAQLDTVPDATASAWLSALSRAGVGVSWAGPLIPATAIEVFPATDPAGGVVVLTSAPASTARLLSDALGPLDTLRGAVSSARLASVEGDLTLTSGMQPARAEAAPRNQARRVLVAGAAGWEAKFVIAALEESGWSVDARLFVAPERDVIQGPGGAIDTSRYAAVVLLDSAGAESVRGLESFVRSGGGAVLAGEANLAPRAAGMTAWRAGKRELAPLGTLAADSVWRGLSRLPLVLTKLAGAIVLEQRTNGAELVARRHYNGRVVGVGYDQTWRWRMAGGDGSRVEHREWWSRVVASAALRSPVTEGHATGAAPLASLFSVLGAPSRSARVLPVALSAGVLSNLLGAVVFASLLAEWLSRRARGAK